MYEDMDPQIAAWATMPRARAANAQPRLIPSLAWTVCLAVHLAFFAWLSGSGPQVDASRHVATVEPASRPIEVQWIAAPDLPASPPMPRKRRALRSAPPDPDANVQRPSLPQAPLEAPAAIATPRHRSPRLVDELSELDLLPPGEARFGKHDPMRPMRARLPGSGERIVGNFTVHRETTPADIVNMVGGLLFGGNVDLCPEIVGKLQEATLLHPERYDDAQRRDLVERERRCRYR